MFCRRQHVKFCRDKHTFVAAKDVFCRDKHVFVVSKGSLSRQNFIRGKIMFAATKLCSSRQKFCCDKNMSRQKTCLSRQKRVCCYRSFVATKKILVAVPANDSQRPMASWSPLAFWSCRDCPDLSGLPALGRSDLWSLSVISESWKSGQGSWRPLSCQLAITDVSSPCSSLYYSVADV